MSDPLILGSSSPYRAQALRSLGLVFTQISPNVDETPRSNESPEALAARLAETKAVGIAQQHAGAIVIGSDQVGFCSGRLLSKPGSKAYTLVPLRLRPVVQLEHTVFRLFPAQSTRGSRSQG